MNCMGGWGYMSVGLLFIKGLHIYINKYNYNS
jgi:hypothetical protein